MTDNCAVFVTARNVSVKTLNRACVLLNDFQHSDDPLEDRCCLHLFTNRSLPESDDDDDDSENGQDDDGDDGDDGDGGTLCVPPLPTDILEDNQFADMDFAAINAFVRANEARLEALEIGEQNWVVIDQKGIDTDTVVYFHRDNEWEGEWPRETPVYLHTSRGLRVPFTGLHSLHVNIWIANMDFPDFIDGVDEDGVYHGWLSDPKRRRTDADIAEDEKKEAMLAELREQGHVD